MAGTKPRHIRARQGYEGYVYQPASEPVRVRWLSLGAPMVGIFVPDRSLVVDEDESDPGYGAGV